MLSIRDDSSALMSTRHPGSRKTASCLIRGGRECCRFDSIRSSRDDSSALMSTRHPGSRFARHLDKICNLLNWEGRECCRFNSIRDDSSALMSTRHPRSRFARHLDKICNLLNWEGGECCRFDSIRSIRIIIIIIFLYFCNSICNWECK